MKSKPFFWHILPSFLLISGFSSIILLLYTSREFKQFYHEQTVKELTIHSILFKHQVKDLLDSIDVNIDSLAVVTGKRVGIRYTLILKDGRVIADTEEDPTIMDNHGNRPEIVDAYNGDTGVSIRYSKTLTRDLMYVAIPIFSADSIIAVSRSSVPLVTLSERMGTFSDKLVISGIIIILLSVLISIWLSQRLSKPLVSLKTSADKFARGDLFLKPSIRENIQETAELATSMESMAKQLSERINTITTQKNEQDAILTAMIEGVVAVDNNERIIMINDAAGKMLGIDSIMAKGKLIQESIRNTTLQKFIQQLLTEKTSLKKEVTIFAGSEYIVEVQGTVLKGTEKDTIGGVLFVMHDVTHIKELENMRRDFVANVSHELRTPLTSIKGFVETLLDGAVNKQKERERFLTIIDNHVNRLNALIEDLLTISHLEKDGTREELILEQVALNDVIENAVNVCADAASNKSITIKTQGDKAIQALINPSLFEQALVNLIDNAIKYSDENTEVTITSKSEDTNIIISVTDQGVGIAKRHFSRLFERFYRIDKARSRKMGGTGLGLSIVKHIVNIHNGTVRVESHVGKGSTFTIILPLFES